MVKTFRKYFLEFPHNFANSTLPRKDLGIALRYPRVFYWLNQRPYKYLVKHLVADAFFISYPKCGRTWLITMLGHFLKNAYNIDRNIKPCKLGTIWKENKKMPLIVARHEDMPHWKQPDELNTDKTVFENKKVIFMVRDPRDVAVSFYYQRKFREAKPLEVSLDELTLNGPGGIDTIIKYYNIWLEASDTVGDFHLVKYESLKEDTFATLKRIIGFLDLPTDEELIRSAVDYGSFENMKKREKKRRLKEGKTVKEKELKTRKGRTGGYKEEFSEESLEMINKKIKDKLNPQFEYS